MQHEIGWTVAPVLGVADVLKAVEYFRSALGFACPPEALYGGAGGEPPVYAIVRRDGAAIHLQIRRRPLHLDARHEHESDAYLYVDDIDALYAEYRQKGVTICEPLREQPYGIRDFGIETPDGHRLRFGAVVNE